MFITLISPISLAFGLVSEPCLFGLIIMFAHRRRELRVLWDGHFYDEEFVDREDMKYALEMIEFQSDRGSVKTIESRII